MKKVLVFETSLRGHILEYIHHLYVKSVCDKTCYYYFVLPDDFESLKSKFDWPVAENVEIIMINSSVVSACEEKTQFLRAYSKLNLLLKYVKQLRADLVILVMMMDFAPFLAFANWGNTKVCGIIYKVFLNERLSTIRLLINKFIYTCFSKRKCFDRLFILNDVVSAERLNSMFNTSKFMYLPDPVPRIDMKKVRSIRKELNISDLDKMFLHFGGLTERKGTLDILRAAEMVDPSFLSQIVLVFAGKVNEGIREAFYELVGKLDNRIRVIVYDKFCSYDLLYDLCYSCDVILVPYHFVNLSSGVIGYAAFFGKPVVGPSQGLLGNLISVNSLGVTFDEVSPEKLKEIFTMDFSPTDSDYCLTHSVDDFVNTIIQ
jgi:glycosyltransferase involved in cell wall biosynthesis